MRNPWITAGIAVGCALLVIAGFVALPYLGIGVINPATYNIQEGQVITLDYSDGSCKIAKAHRWTFFAWWEIIPNDPRCK